MNVAHILGLLAFGHAGIAMTLGAQASARPDPQRD